MEQTNNIQEQTNNNLQMLNNTPQFVIYAFMPIDYLRKIFGTEMTYNDLANLTNPHYQLKVEFARDNEMQIIRVWFDDKMMMDSKYPINHSCNMFYHLNELEKNNDDYFGLS